MQLLDTTDPRRPNVQIAASIRAAILNGELAPGAQLPSGEELAKLFGVSRMTITAAVRTLREEGFVRSQSGSGVYVRDRATLPIADDSDQPLAGAASFLFEMGQLKRVTRTGWLLLGIPQPETVAEHSFRVGIVGTLLAAMEGADVGRTTALALLHDAHETRIGDVPSVGRAYMTTAAPEAISAHQTAAMPDEVAKVFQSLTAEYEAGETIESQLAHDADKIETLLQAIEYQAQGHNTAAWQKTSVRHCEPSQQSSLPRPSTQPTPITGGQHSQRATTNYGPAPRDAPASLGSKPMRPRYPDDSEPQQYPDDEDYSDDRRSMPPAGYSQYGVPDLVQHSDEPEYSDDPPEERYAQGYHPDDRSEYSDEEDTADTPHIPQIDSNYLTDIPNTVKALVRYVIIQQQSLQKPPGYGTPINSPMEFDTQQIIDEAIEAGAIPPDNLAHPEPDTIADLEATAAEAAHLHKVLTELRERDVPLTAPEAKFAIAGLHEIAQHNAQTARQLTMHALERRLMTQAEAANLLDVNQRTISRWSREATRAT